MTKIKRQFAGGRLLENESSVEVLLLHAENKFRAERLHGFLAFEPTNHGHRSARHVMTTGFPRFYTPNCARKPR